MRMLEACLNYGWTKVTYQSIRSFLQSIRLLFQVHVIQDKLMFFLDNPRAASQLKRLGRVDVDNDSLTIRVFPSPPPRREFSHRHFNFNPKPALISRSWGRRFKRWI